jgi:(4-O-methyl)-D-glucuronate---lignin esterase
LDPELIGKEIELDCGVVGVTTEVWLNGEKVGERAWEPYRLDVAKYLRPGKNTLKIAVTNTDSNRRAEANVHRYEERKRLPGGRAIPFIEDIGPSGLIGPVRLVPFITMAIDPADNTR